MASLNHFQYYAYTYNQFWQIILTISNIDMPHNKYPYKNKNLITNDFNNFYQLHPKIKKVYFNGNKAAKLYQKHVLPELAHKYHALPFQILPSTSPANARLTPQMKFESWNMHLGNS